MTLYPPSLIPIIMVILPAVGLAILLIIRELKHNGLSEIATTLTVKDVLWMYGVVFLIILAFGMFFLFQQVTFDCANCTAFGR